MDKFDIIEKTDEAFSEQAKKGYGQNVIAITDNDIMALKNGKCLGCCDGEYTSVIIYVNN